MKLFSTLLLILMGFSALQAQVSKDAVVPITATLNTNPTSITLTWENPGNADLLILRRAKGQAGTAWQLVLSITASNLTSLTDNGAATGQTYEYVIQRTVNTVNAFGYAHVAVNATPVNSRGKILIFVDSTTADALGVELVRMKNDMRGDGWWPIGIHTGPNSTVQSIKSQIVSHYNADPGNVKAVLLIGNVPIPYSGDANWDGHDDHAGAWPSDAYYADVDGVWTDVSVNNTTPARAANDNVPGDGKFDQSIMPSAAELQVGRIDFRRMNAAAFGVADQIALVKRYLDKNHKWRIGEYVVNNKALVDDNFGYFGGEAFAANGFRNAYPIVGESNVIQTDFFGNSNPESYLLGYACGGGNYNGADGVGSSSNFATDSVNIVFTNLFGSYFGDWDYETNPFMPAALASRGGILTCSWAGRPHWFNQAFTSGETIGYCTKETMNAQYNNGFFGSIGESGAHVALLGDPTLRAHVVKPATNLALSAPSCNSVELTWTASADAVDGYHVYRGPSQDGPFTRLTATPVAGTSYTDNAPLLDTLFYQVRAIKNVSTPGGGTYANNAIGFAKSIIFLGTGGPNLSTTNGELNCASFSTTLTVNANPANVIIWDWVGPNNFSSSQQNPTVSNTGTYTVTAIDANGCSTTATATVVGNFNPPSISASVSNSIDCVNNSTTITVTQTGLSTCTISGPGGFFVQGFSAIATVPGTYTITATSSTNGCIGNTTVQVVQDVVIPSVAASNGGYLTCLKIITELLASTNLPGSTFEWSGPCVNGASASCPGVYTVVVTSSNGCSNSATTTVEQDITQPIINTANSEITCVNPTAPLLASWDPTNASAVWTGPCVVPGFPPTASCAGIYTVVVTNLDNGCTNSATAIVTQNLQPPTINLPPAPPLTCAAPCYAFPVPVIPGVEIYLNGQLLQPGTTVDICQPGTYVLTAQYAGTNCSQDIDLVVNQDITPPVADAGPIVEVSCNVPIVQLDGSGSSAGPTFTYSWSGPAGFNSSIQNPAVTAQGTYTIEVTNTANGCTSIDQTEVNSDGSLPSVNPTVSGQLNCSNTSVQLQSGNNDPGATYLWTGPNGFTSTLSNPTVSAAGTYTVLVSVGACNASDEVEVNQAQEFLVSSGPSTVDCDGVVESCYMAIGGTPPYTYLWSNGSTDNCASFPGGGAIGVTITDNGGCSFTNTQTIQVPPPLEISLDPIAITCTTTNLEICATASGGTPPYVYNWSNGSTGNCAIFSAPSTIGVTVTDANGCIAPTELVIVLPPAISISYLVVDESAPGANNGSIDLSVTGGSGQFVYTWSNTQATTQDLSGLDGGIYIVTVTDVISGCTETTAIQVNTSVGTGEAAWFEQFLLSPNPTEGLALLTLKLHDATLIRVEVRDIAGRLVWENPSLETNALNLPIDLTQHPAGMYSVSVWFENQVFVRKLAVLR